MATATHLLPAITCPFMLGGCTFPPESLFVETDSVYDKPSEVTRQRWSSLPHENRAASPQLLLTCTACSVFRFKPNQIHIFLN
ncbi:hypothetical protein XENOCAPTIV_006057 [Xenoophorus captivus]|uniref:Secreted protein n=1 Tax=Xenoophorus captivus TaxID=1517983 RepID=A0ABV0R3B6_9TELE